MGGNKTQATSAPVETYLAGIANTQRRADAKELASLMARATGSVATMWGRASWGSVAITTFTSPVAKATRWPSVSLREPSHSSSTGSQD